jgi:hypothetical protein
MNGVKDVFMDENCTKPKKIYRRKSVGENYGDVDISCNVMTQHHTA